MEVQQFSLIPPPPPSKRKKRAPLITIGLIIVAGLYLFARMGLEIPWLDNFSKGNTARAELKSLKQNAKVPSNLPNVTNEEPVDFAAMPERARALFPTDHKDFLVSKLKFSDGSTGFRVEYQLDTQVINEYRNFLDRWYAQGPYETAASTRVDQAAYSVMKNQFYNVEGEFLQLSDNSISVRLVILLK